MSSSRAEKKEKTYQKEEREIGREERMSNSEQTVETEKQVQTEQPRVTCEQKQKEKIQAYTSAVPLPQRLQKARRGEQFIPIYFIFTTFIYSIRLCLILSNFCLYLLDRMLELQRQLVFDDDQTLTEVDIMLKC